MSVIARHPNGEQVEFREDEHTYTVLSTGQKLVSATTWIGRFFPKFDAPAVAARCAGRGKYAGMQVPEILAAWEAEGLRGRSEGTCAHNYADCRLKDLPAPEAISERAGQLFVSVDLGLEKLFKHYTLIASEDILFSPEMGIAGTTDLLMYHPATRALLILDWKNNKEIKRENPWERGLGPLKHLEASDTVKYGLQLSLYKRLILDGGYFPDLDFKDVRMGLLHLRPGVAPETIRLEAMDREINEMLGWESSRMAA